MFGILVGSNPSGLSASTYIEQQQNNIRSLNSLLPAMGATCTVLILALAILSRGEPTGRYLLSAAAVLIIVSGAVTRFANQPINAVVMTWRPQGPPAHWMQQRDAWWRWHIVRTITGIAAFALIVLYSYTRPTV